MQARAIASFVGISLYKGGNAHTTNLTTATKAAINALPFVNVFLVPKKLNVLHSHPTRSHKQWQKQMINHAFKFLDQSRPQWWPMRHGQDHELREPLGYTNPKEEQRGEDCDDEWMHRLALWCVLYYQFHCWSNDQKNKDNKHANRK